MYGPHYVWITFNLMPFKFWIPNQNDNLECSEEEMTCIAENHFSFYGATTYKPSNLLIDEVSESNRGMKNYFVFILTLL